MKGIIIIILIFTSNLWSQEFSMDLSGSMEEGIIGAPIYIRIELKNTSGREQKVSGLFKYEYNLKKKNGEVIKRRPESIIENLYAPCEKTEINYLENEWKEVKIINLIELYKIDKECEYILEVKAGPMCKIGINKEGKTDENVWYGKTKQEIKINIREPIGQDREAYEYFKNSKYKGVPLVGEGSKEVLDKFPTSTYAGWVMRESTPFAKWAVNKDKYKEEIEKFINLVNNFISANPDFADAGSLAAEAAFFAVDLDNYKIACDLFKKAIELPKINKLERTEGAYKKLKEEGRCK